MTHETTDPIAAEEGFPYVSAGLVVACALCTGVGWFLGSGPWAIFFFVAAYATGGARPLAAALGSLAERKLDVDLLMILAALGAAVIDEWTEGAILLFLFSFSGTLEAVAIYQTHRSIRALVDLRPRQGRRVDASGESIVPIEGLVIGERVRILPGEQFPIDGVVLDGETAVDESAITGESIPVAKRSGDEVYAGTLNGQGSLLVEMTRPPTDTKLDRVIQMVAEAQEQKPPVQQFFENWQSPYVIGVIATAALAMLLHVWIRGSHWGEAFYQSMVLLVAASPCAVIASVPSVTLSAIANAGMRGVLIKGGVYLQALGQVRVLALDKTGTLTQGVPVVTEVWSLQPGDEQELLQLAASIEQRSEHPLAGAVLAAARQRELPLREPLGFASHPGAGVHGVVDGRWIGIGTPRLFETHQVELPAAALDQADMVQSAGGSALLIASQDGALAGVIAIADQPREEAAAVLARCRELGVERFVVLTGDHVGAAEAVAEAVGVDEVFARLLPEEKVRQLRTMQRRSGPVAMLGDGVNDAPALAAATVGIAMGGAGTDAALEAADVVLMADDLHALPIALALGRAARERIRQNVVFALSMVAALILGSFFGLPLWLGVIGHEGSTLLVVLNGVRMLWEEHE